MHVTLRSPYIYKRWGQGSFERHGKKERRRKENNEKENNDEEE
jgi:hypothetical protein